MIYACLHHCERHLRALMSQGYLSAFPQEKEFLYPPLVYVSATLETNLAEISLSCSAPACLCLPVIIARHSRSMPCRVASQLKPSGVVHEYVTPNLTLKYAANSTHAHATTSPTSPTSFSHLSFPKHYLLPRIVSRSIARHALGHDPHDHDLSFVFASA